MHKTAKAGWLGAKVAAALLDVKRATLYSCVSRGWVRSRPAGSGRGRRREYNEQDVLRLRQRGDARSGHGAVAAGALRWGEPVLESSITEIRSDGFSYRGHDVVALACDGTSFEQVAELLWQAEIRPPACNKGDTPPGWPIELGD